VRRLLFSTPMPAGNDRGSHLRSDHRDGDPAENDLAVVSPVRHRIENRHFLVVGPQHIHHRVPFDEPWRRHFCES
jgi:hypothetical protein